MVEYRARLVRRGQRTVVEFPDCPGCTAHAHPHRDLRAIARNALERWLEARLANGDAPPEPRAASPAIPGRPPIAVSVSPLLAIRLQIRWARQERGLSQGDLGELLGVSRQQVALLEAPNGNPTLKTLERAADALGVELAVELREPHAQSALTDAGTRQVSAPKSTLPRARDR